MRVLIIPEDPTLDRYVLGPVVEKIFDDLGRRPRIDVLADPHLSGVEQALDSATLAEIIEDNPMIDLFLLLVDRDCDRQGNSTKAAARMGEHPGKLIATLAREEVEVWPLALHRADLETPWKAVLKECDPKEVYFDPFILHRGWLATVGKGRKRAMRGMGQGWRGLLKVCPEIADLKRMIAVWLESTDKL